MGKRKHNTAEAMKEARKKVALAKLNDVPTSPRKMRLVADMIRGMKVNIALHSLLYSPKAAAKPVYKLLRSAIANWEAKNPGQNIDDANLIVQQIFVDEGRTLRRIQPSNHGRAYRIRKRSNHVTIIVGSRVAAQPEVNVEDNK